MSADTQQPIRGLEVAANHMTPEYTGTTIFNYDIILMIKYN